MILVKANNPETRWKYTDAAIEHIVEISKGLTYPLNILFDVDNLDPVKYPGTRIGTVTNLQKVIDDDGVLCISGEVSFNPPFEKLPDINISISTHVDAKQYPVVDVENIFAVVGFQVYPKTTAVVPEDHTDTEPSTSTKES